MERAADFYTDGLRHAAVCVPCVRTQNVFDNAEEQKQAHREYSPNKLPRAIIVCAAAERISQFIFSPLCAVVLREVYFSQEFTGLCLLLRGDESQGSQ